MVMAYCRYCGVGAGMSSRTFGRNLRQLSADGMAALRNRFLSLRANEIGGTFGLRWYGQLMIRKFSMPKSGDCSKINNSTTRLELSDSAPLPVCRRSGIGLASDLLEFIHWRTM